MTRRGARGTKRLCNDTTGERGFRDHVQLIPLQNKMLFAASVVDVDCVAATVVATVDAAPNTEMFITGLLVM